MELFFSLIDETYLISISFGGHQGSFPNGVGVGWGPKEHKNLPSFSEG